MAGRLEFEFGFSRKAAPRPAQTDPMRILVLGDFSARGPQSAPSRPLQVDIDNLEARLARLAPRIALPAGQSGTLEIEVRELDDFHPDTLYRRLEIFERLRGLRRRLLDPSQFAVAAAELSAGAEARAPEQPVPGGAESDTDTVSRLLGGAPAAARAGSPAAGVDALLREIVAPHIVPGPDPYQDVYVASLDEAVTAEMRRILHAPAFQSLEALWRGLHWLVTSLELDETLEVHLMDVSKEALAADLLGAGDDPTRSALQRLLVDTGPDGARWSVMAGAYSLSSDDEDVRLLAALGALGSRVGAPFVATASPQILGCHSYAEAADPAAWPTPSGAASERWSTLRKHPAARWLGLALPRVLLRVPYGEEGEPLDGFEFDELGPDAPDRPYLWGPPALACALLLGRAFQARGWSMEPGDALQVDDLPAHTFERDGEQRLAPCAEVVLSERAADAILARGIMPLMSFRNQNAVRLYRFQSLAEPASGLAGPWK